MRKDFQGLVDQLKASTIEIAGSTVEDREALLAKSFTEFGAALDKQLVVHLGVEPTILRKGLNHISAWASAINRLNQTAQAIKTGRPSYMIDSDSNMPPETLPQEVIDDIDRAMQACVITLRSMVNNTVELPSDELELTRLEAAGQLMKLDGPFVGEMLIKTDLPDDLRQWIEDPVDLFIDRADLGNSFLEGASADAEVLMEGDLIPEELMKEYPALFMTPEEQRLGKAFPPKKKPPQAAADPAADPADGDDGAAGDGAADQGTGDETMDTGDGADPTAGDIPTDPWSMIARLSSMITVIAGAQIEGAGAAPGQGNDTFAGNPNDPANVGMQRQEQLSFMPLQKILAGEIEVNDQTVVRMDDATLDLLEELIALREKVPALEKQVGAKDGDLVKLRQAMTELEGRAAPGKGFVRQPVHSVTKAEETGGGSGDALEKLTRQVTDLVKIDPQGDSAARAMIAAVHQGGGRPYAPLPGQPAQS